MYKQEEKRKEKKLSAGSYVKKGGKTLGAALSMCLPSGPTRVILFPGAGRGPHRNSRGEGELTFAATD